MAGEKEEISGIIDMLKLWVPVKGLGKNDKDKGPSLHNYSTECHGDGNPY